MFLKRERLDLIITVLKEGFDLIQIRIRLQQLLSLPHCKVHGLLPNAGSQEGRRETEKHNYILTLSHGPGGKFLERKIKHTKPKGQPKVRKDAVEIK